MEDGISAEWEGSPGGGTGGSALAGAGHGEPRSHLATCTSNQSRLVHGLGAWGQLLNCSLYSGKESGDMWRLLVTAVPVFQVMQQCLKDSSRHPHSVPEIGDVCSA